MGQLLKGLEEVRLAAHQYGVFSDFIEFVTGDVWTSLAADTTATVTVGDAAGGIAALFTDGTDNNEAAIKTTKELFKFLANKPIVFRARVQYAEAATDDANVFVGLADALGANMMVDNGAGPKTSFSGAGFYKVDGGTRWAVVSSNGATQTLTPTAHTAGGSGYVTLEIEVTPIDSASAKVTFRIDLSGGENLVPVQYYDDSNRRLNQVEHTVLFASATEMQAGAYVKAGGANAETLNVDYIGCYQAR